MRLSLTEHQAAIQVQVCNLLEDDPVFLDTETTGFRSEDQVIEISIVDVRGAELFHSLVKPTVSIPPNTTAIHGLTDADVQFAPTMADLLPALTELLNGRTLVIYNAMYDLRMLVQSARPYVPDPWSILAPAETYCAMELYAEYWGEWNPRRRSYRWQSLGKAAQQQGIELPPDLHRAHADAELTRRLFLAMAGRQEAKEGPSLLERAYPAFLADEAAQVFNVSIAMRRKSVSDYPADWPEIAQRVKQEAGWKCVRCGHPHDPKAGYCLTVHHLDLDPSNCHWWNIPALCQRCHLSIQGRVIMVRPWLFEHSDWFKPYVAGFYAFVFLGQDLTKAEVEQRLDELLAFGQPWLASGGNRHDQI